MDMNQQDFNERMQRRVDGNASDEDNRLIDLYRQEGYEWDGNSSGNSPDSTRNEPNSSEADSPSTAQSTDGHSKPVTGRGRSTASSAEKPST